MWWRPDPSSVSPMYMPGRLRTASRPFSILIWSAPYSSAPVLFFRSDLVDHVVEARPVVGVADVHARPLAHGVEAFQHLDLVGAVLFGARAFLQIGPRRSCGGGPTRRRCRRCTCPAACARRRGLSAS